MARPAPADGTLSAGHVRLPAVQSPPRRPSDFADRVALEQAIGCLGMSLAAWLSAGSGRISCAAGSLSDGDGKYPSRSHFPDNHANPGKRRENQIHHRSEHEYVEGAVVFFQQNKNHAQQAVSELSRVHAEQTRYQEISRAAVKPQQREGSRITRGTITAAILRSRANRSRSGMRFADHQPHRKNK